MIVVPGTSDVITVQLGSATATNAVEWASCFRDITAAPTYVGDSATGSVATTSPATIVSSPAAATNRIVDHLSLFNADTVAITATIRLTRSATASILWKGTLLPGYGVTYTDGGGWKKTNANGDEVTSGVAGQDGSDGVDGLVAVQEIEIDFGSSFVLSKTFTIFDAGVSAASKIVAVQSGAAATGREADENEMDALVLRCKPEAGQFLLFADAMLGPVKGKFKINYVYS